MWLAFHESFCLATLKTRDEAERFIQKRFNPPEVILHGSFLTNYGAYTVVAASMHQESLYEILERIADDLLVICEIAPLVINSDGTHVVNINGIYVVDRCLQCLVRRAEMKLRAQIKFKIEAN